MASWRLASSRALLVTASNSSSRRNNTTTLRSRRRSNNRGSNVKANEILRQAADVIEERGKLRDTPEGERSMARAVAAFNVLTGASMTELEGWMFMSVLKLSRATAGAAHLDDFTDLAGYAALAAECMDRPAPEPLPKIDREAMTHWNNNCMAAGVTVDAR